MNDNPVSNKLRDLRLRAGLSRNAIAARIGIPESTYKHYEARLKEPFLPIPFAEQVATALAGSGVNRDEVMELAGIERAPPTPSNGNMIAVYDVQASAGYGAIVEYDAIAYSLAFPPGYLQRITKSNPKDLMIVSVKGDSMVPTLMDDDVVMIDRSKTSLNYDGMFVFRYGDALHVKRVSRSKAGKILATSDNRALYDPIEYDPDEITVIGRVIWYARKT